MAKLDGKFLMQIILAAIYKINILAIDFINALNISVSNFISCSYFIFLLPVIMLSTISKSFQKSTNL